MLDLGVDGIMTDRPAMLREVLESAASGCRGERLRDACADGAPSPLPHDLAVLVKPDDPEWFARELAIAVAPPWWFWRFMLRRFSWLVSIFGRVEVTGRSPRSCARDRCSSRPTTSATSIRSSSPSRSTRWRDAPHHGHRRHHLRADRRPAAGADRRHPRRARHRAGPPRGRVTEVALVHGGHVVAYPEGRVGLTPDGWPERGRTGMARLALGMGVPVIPVSQWGAHEVLQYGNDWGKLRTVRAGRRPPAALQVHVGPPVKLDDLRMGRVGDANRARYRIAAAITRGMVPLRADEDDRPPTSTRPGPRRRWPPSPAASSLMTSRDAMPLIAGHPRDRDPPVLDRLDVG